MKINKYLGFTALSSTYIEPIVNQRWAKTGVPGEKPPDLPVQNLASNMCPERDRPMKLCLVASHHNRVHEAILISDTMPSLIGN